LIGLHGRFKIMSVEVFSRILFSDLIWSTLGSGDTRLWRSRNQQPGQDGQDGAAARSRRARPQGHPVISE
jgi:hypothetical protein